MSKSILHSLIDRVRGRSQCDPRPVQASSQPPRGAYDSLLNEHGVLLSTRSLDTTTKRGYSLYFAYRERAEVALHVAYMYSGGDYFEFGSDGMGTFRNFLSAFDLNELTGRFPDTRFYAFDVFGAIGTPRSDITTAEQPYFESYANEDKLQQSRDFITQHDICVDKVHLVQGYFQDTLTPALKNELIASQRRIGFAFLDCNITSSYVVCLDFVYDLLFEGSYVYMDEYFTNKEVPGLFEQFGARLRARNLRPIYVRNAGAFGALYLLIRA